MIGGAEKKKERARKWSRELYKAWKNGEQGQLRDASEVLRAHYKAEAHSYFIQAGKQVLEQDERPMRFFFDSARSHQQGSYIEDLQEGKQVVTSTEEMLRIARFFYSDLFGVKEVREDLTGVFLDAIAGRIPKDSTLALEGPITLE